MAIASFSSLLAVKTFFVSTFVANRDKKYRPSLISSAMVGLETNDFFHLYFVAKLFSDEKIKFRDE